MSVLNAIIFTVLIGHRTQTGNVIPTYQTHSNSELDANLDFGLKLGLVFRVKFTLNGIILQFRLSLVPK